MTAKPDNTWGFSTRAVHGGLKPDPSTGAVMTPVYLTSTFEQSAPGKHKGYDYARAGNPTRAALEANLAAIEGARFGIAFSSGCAAASTVMHLMESGDHVVASSDLYSGTYRLFRRVYEQYGLHFNFVDTSDLGQLRQAVTQDTMLVWLETPSNPLLKVTDITRAAKIAHDAGALCCVDNTFATPYLQQPLKLGADLAVHSTTKYLGGHSDVIGGAIMTNQRDLKERLAFFQNAIGSIPGPMDCFLVLRGIKTLALRMKQHCMNAAYVAEWLREQKQVRQVYYPGLPSHPGHKKAQEQMYGFGGMVTFHIKGGMKVARQFVSATRLIALAESLGGVESLIELPAAMTHASVPAPERRRRGLADGLVRLSVGVEDVQDIVADLEQALEKASSQ